VGGGYSRFSPNQQNDSLIQYMFKLSNLICLFLLHLIPLYMLHHLSSRSCLIFVIFFSFMLFHPTPTPLPLLSQSLFALFSWCDRAFFLRWQQMMTMRSSFELSSSIIQFLDPSVAHNDVAFMFPRPLIS
jgi:hypothetical protein